MADNKPQHWLDGVGDELVQRMNENVDYLTEAFLDGARAPGAADINEDQKLDWYRRKMFNPDGTPNEKERSNILNRVGVRNYVEIVKALHLTNDPFILGPKKLDSEQGIYDDEHPEGPS